MDPSAANIHISGVFNAGDARAFIEAVTVYFPVKAGSGLATFTDFFPIRHLILASVDTFNNVPGTSPWNDILVMLGWGAAGVWVSLRRWDWSPKRG